MITTTLKLILLSLVPLAMVACGGSDSSSAPVPGGDPAVSPAVIPADSRNTVVWPQHRDAVAYRVRFSTEAGMAESGQTAGTTQQDFFVHTGLENGTTYHYAVLAVDADNRTTLLYDGLSGTPMHSIPGDLPGELIEERYSVITDDGAIIRDITTGLEWQRCVRGQTWSADTQSCSGSVERLTWPQLESLQLADDWRVPTRDELRTIIACSSRQPTYIGMYLDGTFCTGAYDTPTVIQTAFPDLPIDFLWSATPDSRNDTKAWYADLGTGNVYTNPKGVASAVLLVRDARLDTDQSGDKAARASVLLDLADRHGLDGRFPNLSPPINPDTDPRVKLGQLLFFSRTLSGDRDIACASCHHPTLSGGDALSLSVGVSAQEPEVLGVGRVIDPGRDEDPRADGGPNMPRNSAPIFNAALFEQAVLNDGRVFIVDSGDGTAPRIRTPDSIHSSIDPEAGGSLLEAQAIFPLVNNREMRAFRYPDLSDQEYRELLVDRLVNAPAGPGPSWHERFGDAFPDEGAAPINLLNIQRALAAYEEAAVFTDSPWTRFLQQRDPDLLSAQAIEGAIMFLKPLKEGGLGCAGCHSGEKFSNEQFYNAGFPQIGRGHRAEGDDPGRWLVTQKESDRYAFRVPSLLNVTHSAPYGHAGTFQNLTDLLEWHAAPTQTATRFAEIFSRLSQFEGEALADLYPDAQTFTQAVIAHDSHQAVRPRLAGQLSQNQINALIAFMNTLTDPCLTQADCMAPYIADPAEDPDGNLLVRNNSFLPEVAGSALYPASIALDIPDYTVERSSFADVENCIDSLQNADNDGTETFSLRSAALGGIRHQFNLDTWFLEDENPNRIVTTSYSGGVTSGYVDDDCWPDLVMPAGDVEGLVLFRNLGGQTGFAVEHPIAAGEAVKEYQVTGVGMADLNGDFRRELFLGNVDVGEVSILTPSDSGELIKATALPMNRSTYGISFSDINGDSYPDFYLAHWHLGGVPGHAPALWLNDGGHTLFPADDTFGTSDDDVDQNFNFAPLFGDLDNDGITDLALTSDFRTSQVLQAESGLTGSRFRNVTNKDVITDQNGMGGVLADFSNNGKLDWFVSSIYSENEPAFLGAWETSGNRLYRNVSESGSIVFEDTTSSAGVREGAWGWGACSADFNNDGFIDIVQVNGWGKIPEDIITDAGSLAFYFNSIFNMTKADFHDIPPRLFINQGNGTFSEQAAAWGLSQPSEGRGVTCFDYDRDGDIDIALLDHSVGVQFWENESGNGPGRRFLNIRLVGTPPNTDAIGARVYLTADTGAPHGVQTQLRVRNANSTFNAQSTPDVQFGLGSASVVDELRVVWPNGSETVCSNLPPNRFIIIDQRDTITDQCTLP